MEKIEVFENSLEIKETQLTNGEEYDLLVKGTSYHKHLWKYGKLVVFSFVFNAKQCAANTEISLFQTPYEPIDAYAENIVTQNGKPALFACEKNGTISIRPFQEISENDTIRLRAVWLTEIE